MLVNRRLLSEAVGAAERVQYVPVSDGLPGAVRLGGLGEAREIGVVILSAARAAVLIDAAKKLMEIADLTEAWSSGTFGDVEEDE